MESTACRDLGTAEHSGDLPSFETLPGGESDDLLLGGGEPAERQSQMVRVVEREGLGPCGWRSETEPRDQRQGMSESLTTPVGTPVIAHLVPGDRVDPGPDVACRLQLIQLLEDGRERLAEEVLGIGRRRGTT